MCNVAPKHPAEIRERALALYAEHGPSEASRILSSEGHDVPSATIRSWAKRQGATVARSEAQLAAREAAKLSNDVKRERLRDELLDLARETVTLARRSKKARERRDHAGSVAIFVDKFQLLNGGATARVEEVDVDRLRTLRDQARDELAERRQQQAA